MKEDVVKNKKLKSYRTELKEREFKFSNSKTGDKKIKVLMELSSKIANQISVSNKGNEKEQKEYLHKLKLDISCSILHQGYLLDLAPLEDDGDDEWVEEDGSINYEMMPEERRYFNLIWVLISTYIDEYPLTNHESEHYGEHINVLRKLFSWFKGAKQAA